ncbi:MAG TPA: hypothetical protein P5116_04660 [Eubacteriales bacterium]|nr:hypothetical protein [Eubacteriales bacterium]
MRTTYFMLALGLILLTVALAILLPPALKDDTPRSDSISFVKGNIMPEHTRFYKVAMHGGGGEQLPADRETRTPVIQEKGIRQ